MSCIAILPGIIAYPMSVAMVETHERILASTK